MSAMWMLRVICVLVVSTAVLCQQPTSEEISSGHQLQLREIRQVMRSDDPSGKNHNLKVKISSHVPLNNIVEWKLWLLKNDEATVSYVTEGDGSNPTSQTEFIFEGNLVDSDSIFLTAKNKTNIVAGAHLAASLKDLRSDVNWVGDYKSGKAASLRVTAGKLIGEVIVDRDVCETADSPCYYITPKPKPTVFERCHSPAEALMQCDERVIDFQEPSELPAVFLLADNNTMEIEFTFDKERFTVEAVAYDPLDHSRLFSVPSFRCLFPIGRTWKQGEKMRCRQKINLPEGQKDMMVLVVKRDKDGNVAESSLLTYGAMPLPDPESNTGVIVGAVFGTLIGIAIIVVLVVCCLKKKDQQKVTKTQRGGSAVYAPTTTTDPAEA